ncbi:MAG: hypothetical protein ACU0AT_00880 [Tranquillimonas sp.]
MTWLSEHSAALQVVLSGAMTLIWLIYLQLILMGVLRQRHSMILINRSAGAGESARCFISNMGAEPVYLISVIADLECDGKAFAALVTDREEISADDLQTPAEATTQGLVESGGFVDIGSFGDLMWRALSHLDMPKDQPVERLTLTIAANSGHSALLVAGRRSFRVGWNDGARAFVPETVSTIQIRNWWLRGRLRARLKAELEDEAKALEDGEPLLKIAPRPE